MSEEVPSEAQDWKSRCVAKKQQQWDSIPKEWIISPPKEGDLNVMDIPRSCGILSPKELEITDMDDIVHILRNLADGTWTSVQVTTAFYKRAIIAHQLTNCLTEIFVERALQRAKEVDDYRAKTGNVMGPLHGLPVSLKDQFSMKGIETIMGYVSWIGNYAEHDAVLVQILYELGAVPFVRTNVPQTLMWGETYNHVFGRTSNPHNTSLTAGGSTGGEGALVAMRGSPLGVGTDIGGSVRIPSTFCGIYTLRPSYERLPYSGALNALEGQESISSVLGPMTNSIEAVKLFTKSIIDAKPWLKDPLVIKKPWSEDEYNLVDHGGRGGQLCFAIMWDNEVVRPFPPMKRAMDMTKAALEAAGHKVIVWKAHRHLEIYKNAETIFVADGGEDYRRDCDKSGEPLVISMRPDHYDDSFPFVDPYVKTLVGPLRSHTAYELWQLHKEKRILRKSYLDHWEATVDETGTGRPVDAIISPATAYPAPPHGLNTDSFYTTIVNAMDYATCCIPVTTVDPKLDQPFEPHEFYNHEDEALFNMYRPELFKDAPVGLQIIGRPQEEEAVISMTEIVDDALIKYRSSRTS
ncbi:general amidase [Schizopora paradoxa]|uniref:General amidase n=1 Tax=Schizopora paradoxa TaxID=27342 RepID=A0A0H2SKD3_9AGAM|nr:general amidase [Schizopora paradoxa]